MSDAKRHELVGRMIALAEELAGISNETPTNGTAELEALATALRVSQAGRKVLEAAKLVM